VPNTRFAGPCGHLFGALDQVIDPRTGAHLVESVVEAQPTELFFDLMYGVVRCDRGDLPIEVGDDRPPSLGAVHVRGQTRANRATTACGIADRRTHLHRPQRSERVWVGCDCPCSCHADLMSCTYDTNGVKACADSAQETQARLLATRRWNTSAWPASSPTAESWASTVTAQRQCLNGSLANPAQSVSLASSLRMATVTRRVCLSPKRSERSNSPLYVTASVKLPGSRARAGPALECNGGKILARSSDGWRSDGLVR
jgi:hypothetical protein